MIGQKRLLKKINNFKLDNFPHAVLLLGNWGSGKHLMANYIATKFGLSLVDITQNISLEIINNMYLSIFPSLYIIDASLITEKEQNILLKVVEEPSEKIFLMVLGESKINLLDTLVNRCVCFNMDLYSEAELDPFIKNDNKDLMLKILDTPGQIIAFNNINLKGIYSLCEKIATKLGSASYTNTLTIVNKLNYKDEYDKYNVDLFLKLFSISFV